MYSDETLDAMILAIINHVDYDLYKNYLPECSEFPEDIPNEMRRLRDIVRSHLEEDE